MIVRVISSTKAATSWQHSFSGSPRASETVLAAVRRSAEHDLGIHGFAIAPLLPTLSNHTISPQGAIEVHPSYIVLTNEKPHLGDGTEEQWVEPRELGQLARHNPQDFSALLGLHATHLPFFGGTSPATRHLALHKERATG